MHTGNCKGRSGFTLLELMVVVLIVSIFSVIAVPLYSKISQRSQRSAAQSQMQNLAGDLERWRAKNLSYGGFTPSGGFESATGTFANKSILIPAGSTVAANNFTYRILILDAACRTSLSPTTPVAGCAGQNWVMIARPNSGDDADTAVSSGYMGSASRLVLDSQGVRCMTSGTASDHIKNATIADLTISDAALCSTNGTSVPWK